MSGLLARFGPRLLAWLLVAVALTWPVALHPGTLLLGDPAVDVWNHAWGYWYVADALAGGRLPLDTALVGAPDGGVLYFIDTAGAVVMAPVTWVLGPAVAYNLALLLRIALSGLAAQLLAEELTGRGPHTWVAGAAYASLPFLLVELTNGISEVCAIQWVALDLWAAARALRLRTRRAWALLGLLGGITSLVTFYYGLAAALAVGVLLLLHGLSALRRGPRPTLRSLAGPGLAALVGAAVALPHWLVFRWSVTTERALIRRDGGMNDMLLEHSAVDPRIFLAPGDFQSVDLLAVYGEPFVHTAYLRWTVVLLAIVGLVARPALRRWGLVLLASAVAALGPFLWWGDDWVRVGGMILSLPFDWLRRLVPQIAITHPLRLGIAAQAVSVALAAGGAAVLLARLPARARGAAAVGLSLLVVGEGLFASVVRFPLPTASAEIPAVYRQVDGGLVLDLPAEVGTTMRTSRYFWYQTAHGRPIPYTPDVRAGSARDRTVFEHFRASPPAPGEAPSERGRVRKEQPRPLTAELRAHLVDTYGLVVVHTDLEQAAELDGSYVDPFTQALGPAEEEGELRAWKPASR